MKKRPVFWYDEKEKLYEVVFDNAKQIFSNSLERQNEARKWASLYANKEMLGLDRNTYFKAISREPVKFNIVASVIDTAVAATAKQRPKVSILTSGGDYGQQRMASKLEDFVTGVFYDAEIYELGEYLRRESCEQGSSFLKVFFEDDKIKAEAVSALDILVDNEESFFGKPLSLYQVCSLPREVAKARFPEHAEYIQLASNIAIGAGQELALNAAYSSLSDQITIVEAWHLPTKPDRSDGKHVITCDRCVLLDEPYEDSDFPFVRMDWKRPIRGYFGTGLAEEIAGIQVEINRLTDLISRGHELITVPRIFVDAATKIDRAKINNEIGMIIPYTGQKPEFNTADAFSPETYRYLDSLISRAYEIAGISQLSATQKKPAGLDSGVALREYSDINSERFIIVSRDYENFYVKVAKLIIRVARQLYKNNGDFKVKTVNGKFIKSINWSEVNLEDSDFVIQAKASSSLPDTKAAKIQFANDLFQQQIISAEEYREMLNMPDNKASFNLANASREYVKTVVEKILDDQEVIELDEFDNLAFAREYGLSQLQQAKLNNVAPETIQLLRDWLNNVVILMEQLQPPPPPPQEQQPVPPQQ